MTSLSPALLFLFFISLCAAISTAHGAVYYLGRSGLDPQTEESLQPGVVYDGSTADHVDAFLRKVPEDSTVHLANHVFQTRGVWDNWLGDTTKGFRLKSGWTLIGSGTNSVTGTVFQLIDVPVDDSGHYHLNAVFSTGAIGNYSPVQPLGRRPNVNQVTIRDLQIDCNYPALARLIGDRALHLAGVQILGNHGLKLINLLLRNAASKKINSRGEQLECFQVYIYNKWAADAPGDYHIDRVAITDYHGGYTSGICVNGNATGIVQNCTVDLKSDDSQRYALNFAAGINNFIIRNNSVFNATRGINNDTGPICRAVTIVSNRFVECSTGLLLANLRESDVLANTFSLDGTGAGIAIRYHPTLDDVKAGACTVRDNVISGPRGEGISLGYHNEFDPSDTTLYWSTNNIIQNNVFSEDLQSKIPPASLAPNIVRPGNRRHLSNYPGCESHGQVANLAAIGFPSDIGPGTGCSYCAAKAFDTSRGHIARVKLSGTKLDMRSDDDDISGYTDFTTGYTTGVRTNRFKKSYVVQWADVHRGRPYRLGVYAGDLQDPYPIFRVYIDYDHDGNFAGAGELVAFGQNKRDSLTATIHIPISAPIGSTRMRVLMGCGRDPGACQADYFWGEVEDYTINILP